MVERTTPVMESRTFPYSTRQRREPGTTTTTLTRSPIGRSHYCVCVFSLSLNSCHTVVDHYALSVCWHCQLRQMKRAGQKGNATITRTFWSTSTLSSSPLHCASSLLSRQKPTLSIRVINTKDDTISLNTLLYDSISAWWMITLYVQGRRSQKVARKALRERGELWQTFKSIVIVGLASPAVKCDLSSHSLTLDGSLSLPNSNLFKILFRPLLFSFRAGKRA